MTTSSQQTTATAVPLDLRTKPRHGKVREEDGEHPPEFEEATGRNGHSVDNGKVKVEGKFVYPPGGPGRSKGTTAVTTVNEREGESYLSQGTNDRPVNLSPRSNSLCETLHLSPPKCETDISTTDCDSKSMGKSVSKLPFRKRPFPAGQYTSDLSRTNIANESPRLPEQNKQSRCSPTKVPKRHAHEDDRNQLQVELLPVTTNGQEDMRPAMDLYQPLPAIAPYFLYPDYQVLHPIRGSSMIINMPIMPLPFPLHPMEEPNHLSGDIAMAMRQDDDGDTALHIAVVKGHEGLVHRLIHILVQAHKDLDIYNNLRQTPLHLAVITNQAALVQALLCAGSDPGALDRHGQTAAHLCCEHGLGACLQLVLSHLSPLSCLEARNYEGLTPLHLAVQNRSKKLVKLLLDSRVDIDAVDIKSGRSPLIHAVENNSMEMISFLIENGCNVNAQSYSGNTALHSACGRGQVEAVRALLRNGADSSLKNYHNDTALMVAKNKKVTDVLRGKGSRSQNPKPLEHSSDPPSPSRCTPLARQHSANGTPVQSPSHTFHGNNFFHR